MDVNSSNLGLQSQLQAQLQQADRKAVKNTAAAPDRGQQRAGVRPGVDGQATNQTSTQITERKTGLQNPITKPRRGNDLSSQAEVDEAKDRVARFDTRGAFSREAPVGRLSDQRQDGRDIPLGSIVDIRV